jgi:ankyrin repeat protein
MNHVDALNEALLDAIFMKQNDEIVRLLDAGAQVNARGKYGNTPLYHAVSDNNPQALRILVERGANVHEKNDAGQSILSEAAHSGLFDICQTLLNHGADVNEVCNKGRSPLIEASRRGGVGIDVRVLLRGANVNHCCNSGFSALWWAVEHKHAPLCNLLVEFGVELLPDKQQRNALHWGLLKASVNGFLTSLMQVANKSDVNLVDIEGQTPLHLAARAGQGKLCEQLLQAGADPLVRWNGKTAEQIALDRKFPDIALLIKAHADAHGARQAMEDVERAMASTARSFRP